MKSLISIFIANFIFMIVVESREFCIEVVNQNDAPSKTINKLLEIDPMLNITEGCKTTIVHRAAVSGDVKSLERLQEYNVSLSSTNNLGESPLHVATYHNQMEVIKFLSKQGVDVNAEDFYRRTPLHRAAEKGFLEPLKLLIHRGSEVNKRTRYYDMTPMHYAAMNDQVHIIRELAKHNFTITSRDADERTPLWHAVSANKMQSVIELVNLGAEITPMVIWIAVDKGYLPIVKYLVSKGADVNAKAGVNENLLVQAAYKNHSEVAKFLIDKGADVRAVCCFIKWTPLHEAALYDRVAVAKLFLDRGADINAGDKYGYTPLDVASDEVKQILKDRGARHGPIFSP